MNYIMLLMSAMFALFVNGVLCVDFDLCRLHDGIYLKPDEFKRFSCAECLNYMPDSEFVLKWKVDNETGWLISPWPNATQNLISPDPDNCDQELNNSFISRKAFLRWKDCCQAADQCCQQQIKIGQRRFESNYSFCPATWDGWKCWTDANPGDVVEGICPEYIWFQDSEQPCRDTYAFKTCLNDGKWFTENNKEWTDFLQCAQFTRIWAREITRLIAYFFSAFALAPALVIFFSIAHMAITSNRFVAVLLVFCQRYFRLSNYFWMLNEGFYLHGLLATAFAKEKDMRILVGIGWGCPFIFVLIYSLLRINRKDPWTQPVESLEWLIYGPCLISLLINLCFLINIIRILFIQLKAIRIRSTSESEQFRKTVRAILLLQPLLGVHYLATLYKPGENWSCWLVEIYYHLDYLLDGLQGALVAVAFCYTNGEVVTVVQRSYRNLIQKRRLSNTISRQSHTNSLGNI